MESNYRASSPALGVSLATTSSGASPGVEISTSPGYLGSTSFSAVLSEHEKEIPADADPSSGTAMDLSAVQLDPDRVQSGFHVLALLYNLKFFESAISRLYYANRYKPLPPFIVEKAVDGMRLVYDEFKPAQLESQIKQFSLQIFRNSSRPMPRSKSMTIDDYIATYTGHHTRWETVALILATAGVGLLSMTDQDPVFSTFKMGMDSKNNSGVKEKLVSQVSDASTCCLAFCDNAASSNEILACAQHADVIMKSQQYGDSSEFFYHGLSDACNNFDLLKWI